MRWPLVIGAIALTAFVASAGTVGAERLLTGADIKDGSITGRDIRPGSLDRTRLEPSARHRVFVSTRRRVRQAAVLNGGNVQVAAVSVPAGAYAVQAVFTLNSTTTGGMVRCWLGDSAGALTSASTAQMWVTYEQTPAGDAYSPAAPMTLIGTATYTAPATITVTCYSQPGLGQFAVGSPVLTAEQVGLSA